MTRKIKANKNFKLKSLKHKKMKKSIVLLVTLVLGFGQIFASDNNLIESEQQIRNEVAILLKSPEITVEKSNLSADIQFKLNKNGEIEVLTVDSNKNNVIDYVKSRLNNKKVLEQKIINVNRVYNLTLIIKKPENI
ncbi:hypothetical protein GCM10022258_23160 [Aquimarina gracilis]